MKPDQITHVDEKPFVERGGVRVIILISHVVRESVRKRGRLTHIKPIPITVHRRRNIQPIETMIFFIYFI